MPDGKKIGAVVLQLLPTVPILVALAIHFILTNFVLLSVIILGQEHYINWLPMTFLFSHFFFFIVGLWTAQDKEGIIPVISFIFVVVVTILYDIIMLGCFFGRAQNAWGDGNNLLQRTWQFSAGMMIINLLVKPLTIVLSCVALYFRIPGAHIPRMNSGGGSGNRDSYQPVYGSTTPSPAPDTN